MEFIRKNNVPCAPERSDLREPATHASPRPCCSHRHRPPTSTVTRMSRVSGGGRQGWPAVVTSWRCHSSVRPHKHNSTTGTPRCDGSAYNVQPRSEEKETLSKVRQNVICARRSADSSSFNVVSPYSGRSLSTDQIRASRAAKMPCCTDWSALASRNTNAVRLLAPLST